MGTYMGIYSYAIIAVVVLLGGTGLLMKKINKENWKMAFIMMFVSALVLSLINCSECDSMREQPYGRAFGPHHGYGKGCCQEHMKIWDWLEKEHTYPQVKE